LRSDLSEIVSAVHARDAGSALAELAEKTAAVEPSVGSEVEDLS